MSSPSQPDELATQCPHCATVFQLSRSELKEYGQQVRCGRCYAVFNAISNLLGDTNVPADVNPEAVGADINTASFHLKEGITPSENGYEESTSPGVVLSEEEKKAQLVLTGLRREAEDDNLPFFTVMEKEKNVPSHDLPPFPPQRQPKISEDVVPALSPAAPLQNTGTNLSANRVSDLSDIYPTPPPAIYAEDVLQYPSSERAEVAPTVFSGSAVAPKVSRQKNKNVVLSVFFVMAMALLFLQSIYFYHSYLTREFSALRPAIHFLCYHLLGCQPGLRHDITVLTIDNSQLSQNSFQPGLLFLQIDIHNRGDEALVWPHIELELKANTGEVKLRRVFAPSDFLLADLIDKGMPAHSRKSVRIDFSVQQAEAINYKVDMFYP